jgi:hypothetical protein
MMNTTSFHIGAINITAHVEMYGISPNPERLTCMPYFNVIKMCCHHARAFDRSMDHYLNSKSITVRLLAKPALETGLCLELARLECVWTSFDCAFPFIMFRA